MQRMCRERGGVSGVHACEWCMRQPQQQQGQQREQAVSTLQHTAARFIHAEHHIPVVGLLIKRGRLPACNNNAKHADATHTSRHTLTSCCEQQHRHHAWATPYHPSTLCTNPPIYGKAGMANQQPRQQGWRRCVCLCCSFVLLVCVVCLHDGPASASPGALPHCLTKPPPASYLAACHHHRTQV